MGNWTPEGHIGQMFKVIGKIEYYGPTNRAYSSLTDDGRKVLDDDLTALWTRNNVATDGTTLVQAESIEVIGTRT